MQRAFNCFRIIALGLGLISVSASAQVVPAPDIVVTTCSVCHGPGGRSDSSNFPRLAGQHEDYLENQLKAFRDHTRSDEDAKNYMWGWARALSDADIVAIGDYYQDQTPAKGIPVAPVLEERGRKIYEQGLPTRAVPACIACHGPGAAGNGSIPRLAGQHASYLEKQLRVFHTELRPGAVAMMAITKGLSDDDMEALAGYLQSR